MSNYPPLSTLEKEYAPWNEEDETITVHIIATTQVRPIIKDCGVDDGRYFEEIDYDSIKEELAKQYKDLTIKEVYGY